MNMLTFEQLAVLDLNPRQARIVVLMQADVEQEYSAKTLAERFGWTLGTTSYHVRALAKARWLRKTRTSRVRGAIQQWYVLNGNTLSLQASTAAVLAPTRDQA